MEGVILLDPIKNPLIFECIYLQEGEVYGPNKNRHVGADGTAGACGISCLFTF